MYKDIIGKTSKIIIDLKGLSSKSKAREDVKNHEDFIAAGNATMKNSCNHNTTNYFSHRLQPPLEESIEFSSQHEQFVQLVVQWPHHTSLYVSSACLLGPQPKLQ
jgi:hypothetical protein